MTATELYEHGYNYGFVFGSMAGVTCTIFAIWFYRFCKDRIWLL